MFSISKITASELETRKLGKLFAEELKPGDVVALNGDLGCGKTILIKGICDGLGVVQSVHSPTYVIINQYEGICRQLPITIRHCDFYRVEQKNEQDELGLDEFFWKADSISLLEWAERIDDHLTQPYWQIDLERVDDLHRKINIRYHS